MQIVRSSSVVEQLTVNQLVAGSNPVSGAKKKHQIILVFFLALETGSNQAFCDDKKWLAGRPQNKTNPTPNYLKKKRTKIGLWSKLQLELFRDKTSNQTSSNFHHHTEPRKKTRFSSSCSPGFEPGIERSLLAEMYFENKQAEKGEARYPACSDLCIGVSLA